MPGKTNEAVSATNRKSRKEGASFESMIERACEIYKDQGLAMITKVPEPRKVIGRTGGRSSAMVCVNAAKADPDFMGSIAPTGQTIVFDAKHTDKERMQRTALSEHQAEILDAHLACGAQCFVAVSFGFKDFFMVPYIVWRDMKGQFGRQYIVQNDEELQRYRIPDEVAEGGKRIIWFLRIFDE